MLSRNSVQPDVFTNVSVTREADFDKLGPATNV